MQNSALIPVWWYPFRPIFNPVPHLMLNIPDFMPEKIKVVNDTLCERYDMPVEVDHILKRDKGKDLNP